LGDLAVIGGAEAEEAEDVVEDMSYVNAGGVAGFTADAQEIAEFSELAEMLEQNERLNPIFVADLPSEVALPASSIRPPIGFGLIIPDGWFSADQRAQSL
jgi:hypothetical protein